MIGTSAKIFDVVKKRQHITPDLPLDQKNPMHVKHQRQKVKSLTNDLSHDLSQRYVKCIYKFLHKKKIFLSPYDIFNKSSISYSFVRDGRPSLVKN